MAKECHTYKNVFDNGIHIKSAQEKIGTQLQGRNISWWA